MRPGRAASAALGLRRVVALPYVLEDLGQRQRLTVHPYLQHGAEAGVAQGQRRAQAEIADRPIGTAAFVAGCQIR